jgi:TPR repeat protein
MENNVLESIKLKAEQGDAESQTFLGILYNSGHKVTQDYKEAVKWYRLAAEQGYAFAQYLLGGMYRYGDGVTRDKAYAHMWWNIAASNGWKDAKESRDIVANIMTPADISEATRLACEFEENQRLVSGTSIH